MGPGFWAQIWCPESGPDFRPKFRQNLRVTEPIFEPPTQQFVVQVLCPEMWSHRRCLWMVVQRGLSDRGVAREGRKKPTEVVKERAESASWDTSIAPGGMQLSGCLPPVVACCSHLSAWGCCLASLGCSGHIACFRVSGLLGSLERPRAAIARGVEELENNVVSDALAGAALASLLKSVANAGHGRFLAHCTKPEVSDGTSHLSFVVLPGCCRRFV